MTDRSYVEALYNQILQRAASIDVSVTRDLLLTHNSDFHLVTEDGDVIRSHVNKDNKYFFVLSEGINTVFLKSRTSRSCDVIGPFVDDRRELGVLVGEVNIVSLNQTVSVLNHLNDVDLLGWDVLEHSVSRWTKGNAKLHLPEVDATRKILMIEILSSNSYVVTEQEDVFKDKKVA